MFEPNRYCTKITTREGFNFTVKQHKYSVFPSSSFNLCNRQMDRQFYTHTHTQKWTYYDPSAPLWFPFKKQSCLSKFPMTSWHSHGHVNTHKYTTPTPPSSFFTLTHTMLYLAKLMTGRTFSPAAEQLRLWEHIFFSGWGTHHWNALAQR